MPEPSRVKPDIKPKTEPGKRLTPERICPDQKERITRRIREVPLV